MEKIRKWLKARREARVQLFYQKIRISSETDKAAFLHNAVMCAYYPLAMAMAALEAPNFIEGTVEEQTTGDFYHIEIRKVKKEEPKP